MSNQKQHFDIAVIGAGIVGCTCAALYVQQGFKVLLIDAGQPNTWQEHDLEGRVSALNLASIRVFESLGVWQDIAKKRTCPYEKMQVWDQNSNARIEFSAADIGLPQLGFIIENDVVVSSALAKLGHNYNASIISESKVSHLETDGQITTISIEEESTQYSANLVVAADGANSKIREILDIQCKSTDLDQSAITCVVEAEFKHDNTALQCFLKTGPIALLPLQGNRYSLVWSSDNEYAEQLFNLSEQEFAESLQQYFESKTGRLHTPHKRIRFPLKQQHALNYFHDGVVLVGDAAHATHPLAGLGANIGLMDVAALVEVTNNARIAGKRINSQPVLRRYERWRKGENDLVLKSMLLFKNGFGSDMEWVKQSRSIGMNMVDRLSPLKHKIVRYASGIDGDLPQICQ